MNTPFQAGSNARAPAPSGACACTARHDAFLVGLIVLFLALLLGTVPLVFLGWFTVPVRLGLSGVVVTFLGWSTMRYAAALRCERPRGRGSWRMYAALGSLLAAGFMMYRASGEYLRGNWDPGVYTMTGAHIDRTGAWLISDSAAELLEKKPLEDLYPSDRGQQVKYPGFYVDPDRSHTLQPQFLPLYPVLLAWLHWCGGLVAVGWANALLMSVTLLVTTVLVARLAGWWTAFFAGVALLLNPIQIWFSGFPTAEVLLQFEFVAFLLAWHQWRCRPGRWRAAAAGLVLASFSFTSVTGFLLALLVGCGHVVVAGRRRGGWVFFLPVLCLAPLLAWQNAALVSMYWNSVQGNFPYMLWILRHPFSRSRLPLFAGLVCLVLGLTAHRRLRGTRWSAVLLGAGGLFAVIGIACLRGVDARNAYSSPLVLMISRTGVLAAVMGALWLGVRRNTEAVMLIGVPILFTVPFLCVRTMQPLYPWAYKRYLAVTLPVLCIWIGLFWGMASTWGRGATRRLLIGVLACALLIRPLYRGRHFAFVRDWAGLGALLTSVSEDIPDGAVVLASKFWGPALEFQFGHTVLPWYGDRPGARAESVLPALNRLALCPRPLVRVRDTGEPEMAGFRAELLTERHLRTQTLDQRREPFRGGAKQRDIAIRVERLYPLTSEGQDDAGSYRDEKTRGGPFPGR